MMRPVDIWHMVEAERLAQAAEAESYRDDEWTTPTPCAAWRVREVIAHLCQTRSPTQLMTGLLKAGFNRDRLVANTAIEIAGAHRNNELVTRLRNHAAFRWTPPGVTPAAILLDTVVHAWDIRSVLQRPVRRRPGEHYAHALEYAVASGNIVRGRRRARGILLSATDVDWRHGSGPVVTGPAEAILAAVTGRADALDDLAGDGVRLLRHRCSA